MDPKTEIESVKQKGSAISITELFFKFIESNYLRSSFSNDKAFGKRILFSR
jgi:hypothetical protein